MFEVDLHSHTLFSPCGLHTLMEMLVAARENGLKGLAITDHGVAVGGKTTSVFFERLNQPVEGIHLFKGVEANVLDETGRTDVVKKYLEWTDIVLLGFHQYKDSGLSRQVCTDIMLNCIEKNSYVDVITHPNMRGYFLDYRRLAKAAVEYGFAVELNNSKTRLGRSPDEETIALMEACALEGALVAVNSDAHTVEEPGRFEAITALMKQVDFPMDQVVNRSMASTVEWLEARRPLKLEAAQG